MLKLARLLVWIQFLCQIVEQAMVLEEQSCTLLWEQERIQHSVLVVELQTMIPSFEFTVQTIAVWLEMTIIVEFNSILVLLHSLQKLVFLIKCSFMVGVIKRERLSSQLTVELSVRTRLHLSPRQVCIPAQAILLFSWLTSFPSSEYCCRELEPLEVLGKHLLPCQLSMFYTQAFLSM